MHITKIQGNFVKPWKTNSSVSYCKIYQHTEKSSS